MRRLLAGCSLALAAAACGDAPPPPAAAAVAEAPPVAAETTKPEASAAPIAPPPPPRPAAELLQVDAAPAPARMPKIELLAPAKNAVVPSAKAAALALKLRVTDWELGAAGNHVCVMLDRGPCKKVTDATKPLALGELGGKLDDGAHVLVAFARRGNNESVKPKGKSAAFAAVPFFVGKKGAPIWKEGAPMLVVNLPDDGPAPADGVLIDCYVANAEVADGKYTVHVSVGGPGLGAGAGVSATSLAPFRIKNAQPGEHLTRFALFRYEPSLGQSASTTTVSYASKAVDDPFATMTRTFQVAR